MTYFSLNVIIPLERYFNTKTKPFQVEARKMVDNVWRKWFKYMLVFIIGILQVLNVEYINRKLEKRETALTTTFDFTNESTLLPFPGLRICIPQIFQFSRLSKQDLMFLYRRQLPVYDDRSNWQPQLDSVMLYLSINGKPINASSVFVTKLDRFFRVCWQTDDHKFTSHMAGALQSIEMIINVAEYEDIVHKRSKFLRHLEIIPFDEKAKADPDRINAVYPSPGRHSLITLRTIKEDSTIRPTSSVACIEKFDFQRCQRSVENDFIDSSCNIQLVKGVLHNITVATYVECMKSPIETTAACGTSCIRTIYKSFKSEAKLKFSKNIGSLRIPELTIDTIRRRLHKAVKLNSIYDSDYRRGVVDQLPTFIDITGTVLQLLSQNPVLNCVPKLPAINFIGLSGLPNVRRQFNRLRTNTYTLIYMSRKYKMYSEKHWSNAVASLMAAIISPTGLNFIFSPYLSTGRNINQRIANKEWRVFVEQHSHNLSVGYEMFTKLASAFYVVLDIAANLDVKSTVLTTPSHTTNLLLSAQESAFKTKLYRTANCHTFGGKPLPFTNNWAQTSRRYLLVNDTKLYSESKYGNAYLVKWYRKINKINPTTGVPIYIDFKQHSNVIVPMHAIYHCMYYKTRFDIFEKQLGLDRRFSYTNMNAKYKVSFEYTLFVLNNILKSDNYFGLRPSKSFDICEEESCACSIAVKDPFLAPSYLPFNASGTEVLRTAREHSTSIVIKKELAKAIVFHTGIAACGKYLDDFDLASKYFYKYFEDNIIKQYDKSVKKLLLFTRAYAIVRKGRQLREFSFLLRTYGLKHRIKQLHTYLSGVMNGDSFETLAVFLARKGKTMVGEIQIMIHDLDTAYSNYVEYFRNNWGALQDAWGILTSNPTTAEAFFLADIFNSTSEMMFRTEIRELWQLIIIMKKCMLQSHILVDNNYTPLRAALMQWLEKINYFIWRAKLYVASKEISRSFMDSNIAVVSIFYETLDVRYETNKLRYSTSEYKSDLGNILTMYYGLEAFSFLQLFTFMLAVAIKYYKKWHQ